MSWLFASDGQSIEASELVFPMNNQDWFPLELTGLISLQSKWLSRIFSSTTVWSHQFVGTQPFLLSSSHICTWLLEKTHLWLNEPLSANWCLCFLICYLGLSELFFQGASVFYFNGCSHCLHWFWSPRKWNLTLFQLFLQLFGVKW